jgi:hypothetical protein
MMSPRKRFNKVAGRDPRGESDLVEGLNLRDRSETGETLVEVLLALIILALASVALITAFGTDISASAEHRSLATFDTALASSITTTTTLIQEQYASVFTTCPADPNNPLAAYPTSAVLTAALNIPGYTATIEAAGTLPAVEYSSGNGFTPTCTSGTSGDVSEPQLITVVVTDTATGYSQSNSVVAIDPAPVQAIAGSGSTPTELVFVTEPEGATVDTPFSTQPILEVEDGGLPVTNDFSPVVLTLSGGTNGASLSSTCSGSETSGVIHFSGCSINEVGTGYVLTATEPTSPNSNLYATTTDFSVYQAELSSPSNIKVIPSTTTAGAINVTFTGSPNAPVGQTYTIKACTDSAMSVNCTTPSNITSGSDLTGLTPGSNYWVQITAAGSGSYLASTSPPKGPTMATLQLVAPTTITLNYGTSAGSLSVSFTPPTVVASGQTYTIKACTNSAMQGTCVSNANVTSNSVIITGLAFTAGSVGTPVYYVQVSANASTGYLASTAAPPTPVPGSHAATSQVKTPTGLSAAPSASQVGAITVAFSEPGGGTAPSSFTAVACTDAAMSANCVTVSNYTSGAQLSGLTPGTSYYVEIIAVASVQGFASSNTAVPSTTVAVATAQLGAPTGVTLGFGTTAGSLSVSFTPPSPAAVGQTYTVKACTNNLMSVGCVPPVTNFTSGGSLTGLSYIAGNSGTPYYVEVIANGSSGFFVSPPSTPVSGADESQIGAPGTPTVSPGTTRAIVVTFTASPGPNPTGYTAVACTGPGISGNCTTAQPITSGGQITGLRSGTSYYVQITAIGSTGYANNVSGVSAKGQAR